MQVSLTAKILDQKETVQQTLHRTNKKLNRTTFIIADKTAAIELTYWGDDADLKVGSTYHFSSITVKLFQTKKLSTTKETTIVEVEDVGPVARYTSDEVKLEVTIMGINLSTDSVCVFCGNKIQINEDLSTVKCNTCNKRSLKQNVEKKTKCELSFTDGNDNFDFILTSEALDNFVPNHLTTPEDKELFFLENNEVQITYTNGTSLITCIQQI